MRRSPACPRSARSAGSTPTATATRSRARRSRARRKRGHVRAPRASPYPPMLTPMDATLPAIRPPSVHRVPRARLVERTAELRRLVRGRRVIDIGFVDEGQLDAKLPRGEWLHELVVREASEAV